MIIKIFNFDINFYYEFVKEVYGDKKVMIFLILRKETVDVISSDLTSVEGYI